MAEHLPEVDASLGLVYRLNILWSQVDYASIAGNYERWNNILGAIYRNLLYEDEVVVTEDGNGNPTKVELSVKDTKIYKIISLQISKAKNSFYKARSPTDKMRARNVWYHALQKKDVWLRKLMMKQKLYLKQTERKPGQALFGSFGKK